jgi:hypothetical protein
MLKTGCTTQESDLICLIPVMAIPINYNGWNEASWKADKMGVATVNRISSNPSRCFFAERFRGYE